MKKRLTKSKIGTARITERLLGRPRTSSQIRNRQLTQTTSMNRVRKLERIQEMRDQLDTWIISGNTKRIIIAILDSKTLDMDEFNLDTLVETAEKASKSIDGQLSAKALTDGIEQNLRLFNLELNLKEKEAEIKELQSKLKELEAKGELSEIAARVAHDINNCLTIIGGNSELIKKGLNNRDEVNEMYDQIDSAIEHSTALMKQILSFSRGINFKRKKTNLSEIVKNAIRDSGRFEQVKVETDIPDNLISYIDPVSITAALKNLFVNAEQAVSHNGIIRVSVEKIRLTQSTKFKPSNTNQNEFICITIEDNGVGIPLDLIKEIFEPYFTTKENGKGTGLGLSIVKRTIDLHSGYITVNSQTGDNSFTRFKIYLPAT